MPKFWFTIPFSNKRNQEKWLRQETHKMRLEHRAVWEVKKFREKKPRDGGRPKRRRRQLKELPTDKVGTIAAIK